jgi:fumarate reductase subunit C
MVLFHTITWISLTPKVLVLWRGDERVDPTLIAASNYLAWLVVSGVVAWVALR